MRLVWAPFFLPTLHAFVVLHPPKGLQSLVGHTVVALSLRATFGPGDLAVWTPPSACKPITERKRGRRRAARMAKSSHALWIPAGINLAASTEDASLAAERLATKKVGPAAPGRKEDAQWWSGIGPILLLNAAMATHGGDVRPKRRRSRGQPKARVNKCALMDAAIAEQRLEWSGKRGAARQAKLSPSFGLVAPSRKPQGHGAHCRQRANSWKM